MSGRDRGGPYAPRHGPPPPSAEVGVPVTPARPGPLPRLHVVTDDAVLAGEAWPRAAEAVLEAGGRALALHVRGPRTGGARLYDLVARLVPRARTGGALLVVNDRVDVALAAGAGGAHLGRRSLPVGEARRLLGPGPRLGLSVHDPDAAGGPDLEGADYVFLGSIHRTPSHPDADPLGAEALRTAVERARGLPVLGIGGVGPEHVRPLKDAGAYGVAVLRGVWRHTDPAAAVGEYLRALEVSALPAGRRH